MYADQVEQSRAVENGLCFGRLDGDDGARRYIGRIGIFDTTGDHDPLLIDWRAPAARPFYLATAATPQGVRRRRHLRTRDRKVTGLNDEVLDLATASPTAHEELTGEAALLAALNAGRTGRMRDIVETIQAEQDRIIRADLPGVLVVQGGPGTGKTAVALHRAAYLLYTHRQQLATPGRAAGRAERHVPALHRPGAAGAGRDRRAAAYLGRPVSRACSARRAETGRDRRGSRAAPGWPRCSPPPYATGSGCRTSRSRSSCRAGDAHAWTRRPCERGRATGSRRSGRPHNLARPLFDIEIVHALAEQWPSGSAPTRSAGRTCSTRTERGRDPPGAARRGRDPWPPWTSCGRCSRPQRLLADLFAAPERIATAAPMLTDERAGAAAAASPGGWTPADVPLLDEAAELLGEDDPAPRGPAGSGPARSGRVRRGRAGDRVRFPVDRRRGRGHGGEILGVTDLIDADRLLPTGRRSPTRLTTAERAAADRTWAFGHVIVDEAQELSPMAWRLLMRRCPSRSMTIVGDVAQTGALGRHAVVGRGARPRTWRTAGGWRSSPSTTAPRPRSWRSPPTCSPQIDPALRPPRSVRAERRPPWDRTRRRRTGSPRELVEATAREAAGLADGRLGGDRAGRPGGGAGHGGRRGAAGGGRRRAAGAGQPRWWCSPSSRPRAWSSTRCWWSSRTGSSPSRRAGTATSTSPSPAPPNASASSGPPRRGRPVTLFGSGGAPS